VIENITAVAPRLLPARWSNLDIADVIALACGWPQLAASVSTRRRQEADFKRDGPAGQSLLAVTPGETRSRPATVARDSLQFAVTVRRQGLSAKLDSEMQDQSRKNTRIISMRPNWLIRTIALAFAFHALFRCRTLVVSRRFIFAGSYDYPGLM